jgi:DNA mismatch endonuclease (patch repair protein)
MDPLSQEKRSWVMSLVKSKDTKPELVVRRMVFALGFRYRLHRADLPGRPDLVFAGLHSVIFVHGCFWHQHVGCRRAKRPEAQADYWSAKLDRNMQRDRRNLLELRRLGWRILTIWECELKKPKATSRKIRRFLKAKTAQKY